MLIWSIAWSKGFYANFILIAHFAWAAWMICGVLMAILGFRWHRLWQWRVFRITHLGGLIATATTPVWADGICPLTEWEWRLRYGSGVQTAPPESESFIIQWIREVLFLEVDPLVISLVTGALALSTIIIFIYRSPWRVYKKRKA